MSGSDTSWHTYTSDGKTVYIDGERVEGTWPREDNNPPWDGFPVTNRATRRRCGHQFKTIGVRTACIHCGEDQS